jgi:hypothetical protein
LASLATAAQLAAKQFPDDPEFQKKLRAFAANQINWILGLNPYDSSMMYGVGRNNPQHMFFRFVGIHQLARRHFERYYQRLPG